MVIAFFSDGGWSSDQWFMMSNGRWIVEHGIPFTNPWSIHGGKIIIEQWITSIIVYLMYSTWGQAGVAVLFGIFLFMIVCIGVLIHHEITGKWFTPFSIIAMSISMCILVQFLHMRPAIITIMFTLLAAFMIIRWDRHGHPWTIIPIISTVLIVANNFHLAMSVMVIIVTVGYMITVIIMRALASDLDRRVVIQTIIMTVLLPALLIVNPYGLDGATFIFKAYGEAEYGSAIIELLPLMMIRSSTAMIAAMLVTVMVLVLAYKRSTEWVATSLLTYAIIFETCLHIRNFQLLIIPVLIIIALYDAKNRSTRIVMPRRLVWPLTIGISAVVIAGLTIMYGSLDSYQAEGPSETFIPTQIVDTINKDKDPVASSDLIGGELIYMGHKIVIDARPELYSNAISGNGHEDWKDFVDSYQDPSKAPRYVAALRKDVRWYLYKTGTPLSEACDADNDLKLVMRTGGYDLYESSAYAATSR